MAGAVSGPSLGASRLAYLRPLIPAAIVGLALIFFGLVGFVIQGTTGFATLIPAGGTVLLFGVARSALWAVTIGTASITVTDAGITYRRRLRRTTTLPWAEVSAVQLTGSARHLAWHPVPDFPKVKVDQVDGQTTTLGEVLWTHPIDPSRLAGFVAVCRRHAVELRTV